MWRAKWIGVGIGVLTALTGCLSEKEESVSSASESAIISCKSRRPATEPVVGDEHLWKTVWLSVAIPQQEIPTVFDLTSTTANSDADQAYYFAKRAAMNGLISLDAIFQYMRDRYEAQHTVDDFRRDGAFLRGYATSKSREHESDLRRTSWLIANVFTRVAKGVDVARAMGWKTLVLPIAERDPIRDDVPTIAERLKQSTAGWCEGERNGAALSLATASDVNGDTKLSLVETVAWFEETYAVKVTLTEADTSVSGTLGDEGDRQFSGLSCLKEIFLAESGYGLGHAVTDPHVNVVPCGTIDLFGNQGNGVRFGDVVHEYMGGPRAYQVVWLSGRLLSPEIKRRLCATDADVFKLYVRYDAREISECGMMNGLYRAETLGLPRNWTDNWSPK